MSDWTKNNPSSIVRVILTGNKDLARMYMPEAKNLLYILKNRMGLGGLDSLVHPVVLPDGTSIRVSSSYGVDQISIDSPNIEAPEVRDVTEEEEENRCSIKINTPTVVQPMRYPGEIHSGEISGTDFIKTIYHLDLSQCPECSSIVWKFLFQYKKPTDPRYYHNEGSIPQMGVEPGGSDPTNHSVYSLDHPSWGEIIRRGRFSESSGYIIWKAYTERSLGTIFSRTGLGILLLTADISGPDGRILCSVKKKIDVDCCHKDVSERKVEIWWEGVHGCMPFMIYGSKHICKMPSSVPIGGASGLIAYSTPFYAAQPLYAIPDIKGGCLPFEWILTGPIKLINTEPGIKTVTYFQITAGPGDCKSPITITLKDRCGTSYTVMGTPGCDDAEDLSILYTSLVMACSQTQELYAKGGVAPYSWALVGGGGTLDGGDGGAVYHSPASNGNCVNNPTIMVTDCCGNSATLSLAVNCYSGAGSALVVATCSNGDACYCNNNGGCNQGIMGCRVFDVTQYDCSGDFASNCNTGGPCNIPAGWFRVNCSDYGLGCPDPIDGCWTNQCGCGGASPCPCDTTIDIRSSAMKAAGCCPINPGTGLPY